MARRNRKGITSLQILGLSAGLIVSIVLIFFVFTFVKGKKSDAENFHGLTKLDVIEFRENSRSLQGNTYRFKGKISDQLKYTASHGRMFSVNVEGEPLGVEVPGEFNDQTIEIGQSFIFKVLVARGGKLVVQGLQKS